MIESPTDTANAFEDLARRMAAGEPHDAFVVHEVLTAAGRTLDDLLAECDRLIAEEITSVMGAGQVS